jgi:hypothetical protein
MKKIKIMQKLKRIVIICLIINIEMVYYFVKYPRKTLKVKIILNALYKKIFRIYG